MPKRATSTSFTKENKPKGGRPKGAQNKVTREAKAALAAMYEGIDFPNYFKKLDVDQQLKLIVGLAGYFFAKPEQSVKHSTDDDSPFMILVKHARD